MTCNENTNEFAPTLYARNTTNATRAQISLSKLFTGRMSQINHGYGSKPLTATVGFDPYPNCRSCTTAPFADVHTWGTADSERKSCLSFPCTHIALLPLFEDALVSVDSPILRQTRAAPANHRSTFVHRSFHDRGQPNQSSAPLQRTRTIETLSQ